MGTVRGKRKKVDETGFVGLALRLTHAFLLEIRARPLIFLEGAAANFLPARTEDRFLPEPDPARARSFPPSARLSSQVQTLRARPVDRLKLSSCPSRFVPAARRAGPNRLSALNFLPARAGSGQGESGDALSASATQTRLKLKTIDTRLNALQCDNR
jgi:hypothetical protein